ncbi:MAG: aminopeptidase P N-terminal domain-containing protein [Eubacteriaceae bacterium]|nr:aminopeptidase P N-terminal domain-containing protein [Eubacteriaceae bacterium]
MNQDFYVRKRMQLLRLMPKNSIALIHSAPIIKSTNDTAYPYEVNRNFYYFTGIAYPGMYLLFYRHENTLGETLFIPRPDKTKEKWTGKMYQPKECTFITGISNVRFNDEIDDCLISHNTTGLSEMYLYSEPSKIDEPTSVSNKLLGKLSGMFPTATIRDLFPLTMPMRAIKSPEELDLIRTAARITKQAIEESLKHIKPSLKEYEVQAAFEYVVKRHGGRLAFNTIVASGANATCLHYDENKSQMNDGDLLLMDCGASYEWFSSDVTRTFPVSGSFSERQLEIYNIVLNANLYIISKVRPGISCNQLNELLIEYYKAELKTAGLVSSDEEVSEYYYHGVSHSLGLDTHDVIDKAMPLEDGMVITVEPGLYFEKYGIGIRIEDDVLVTQNGCEVLTSDIVKDPHEIEEFMDVWEVK